MAHPGGGLSGRVHHRSRFISVLNRTMEEDKMFRRHLGFGVFILGLLLAGTAGYAQVVTGTISGRVTDSTGAVVPGATVQVQNVETGFSRDVQTDAAGRYETRNLPVGSYSITTQQAGFRTEVRRGVTLTVGSEVTVNLEL